MCHYYHLYSGLAEMFFQDEITTYFGKYAACVKVVFVRGLEGKLEFFPKMFYKSRQTVFEKLNRLSIVPQWMTKTHLFEEISILMHFNLDEVTLVQ